MRGIKNLSICTVSLGLVFFTVQDLIESTVYAVRVLPAVECCYNVTGCGLTDYEPSNRAYYKYRGNDSEEQSIPKNNAPSGYVQMDKKIKTDLFSKKRRKIRSRKETFTSKGLINHRAFKIAQAVQEKYALERSLSTSPERGPPAIRS